MYGLAVLLPAVAVIIRLALDAEVDRHPGLILFALPILVVACIGGLGPGLVATATVALETNIYLIAPRGAFSLPAGFDSAAWLGLVVVGVSISALSEAMRRSRASVASREELYAVTLAGIAEGVVATDANGRVLFVNPEAERLTGIGGEDAIGRPVSELVDFTPAASDPAPGGVRGVLRSPAGVHTPVERRETAMRDRAGERTGGVTVLRDRSSEEEADELRRQMALTEQLEKIAATAPGALFALRRVGDSFTIPFAGSTLEAVIGASANSVMADASAFFTCVDERDLAEVRSTLEQSGATGAPWRQAFRVSEAAREPTWVEAHAVPESEPDGGTLWHGVLTDITERNQREAALVAADARWHAVAENLPGASLLIFDEDLRYVEARGQGVRAEIGNDEPLIGSRVGFAVAPDVGAKLERAYRDALEGRESGLEVTADGRVFYARTVPLDLGDGCRHGMVLFIDITERSSAEDRRKRSDERFRTLLEAAPDPIFGVDNDGLIQFASPRVRDVLGYEPDEMIGNPIEMLVPERLRGGHAGYRAAFAHAPRHVRWAPEEISSRCVAMARRYPCRSAWAWWKART